MGTEQDDEDAAFENSFNAEGMTDAPEPEQTAQPAAPATQVDTPAEGQNEEQAPDPFAGLPPAFKSLIEGFQNDLVSTKRQLSTTQQELVTAKALIGKLPGVQSQVAKLEKQMAPPPTAPVQPRFEAVEKIRADLPEVAEAMDAILTKLNTEKPPAAEPEPDPEPQASTDQPDQAELQNAMDRLTRVRPTWVQDKDSAAYQGWVAKQPKDYQDELKTTRDPVVFLDSLAKWDRAVAQPLTRSAPAVSRSERVAAAVTPNGAGRTARPEQIDDEDAAFAARFNAR